MALNSQTAENQRKRGNVKTQREKDVRYGGTLRTLLISY